MQMNELRAHRKLGCVLSILLAGVPAWLAPAQNFEGRTLQNQLRFRLILPANVALLFLLRLPFYCLLF